VRAVEERRRRRTQLALAGTVLLLLALGTGGTWYVRQQRLERRAEQARQEAELVRLTENDLGASGFIPSRAEMGRRVESARACRGTIRVGRDRGTAGARAADAPGVGAGAQGPTDGRAAGGSAAASRRRGPVTVRTSTAGGADRLYRAASSANTASNLWDGPAEAAAETLGVERHPRTTDRRSG